MSASRPVVLLLTCAALALLPGCRGRGGGVDGPRPVRPVVFSPPESNPYYARQAAVVVTTGVDRPAEPAAVPGDPALPQTIEVEIQGRKVRYVLPQ